MMKILFGVGVSRTNFTVGRVRIIFTVGQVCIMLPNIMSRPKQKVKRFTLYGEKGIDRPDCVHTRPQAKRVSCMTFTQ